MVICGNPWGYPGDYCPLELPRDNIHQDTPLAFPHIVSVFTLQCSLSLYILYKYLSLFYYLYVPFVIERERNKSSIVSMFVKAEEVYSPGKSLRSYIGWKRIQFTSLGIIKNGILWKSLVGSMVNVVPREFYDSTPCIVHKLGPMSYGEQFYNSTPCIVRKL